MLASRTYQVSARYSFLPRITEQGPPAMRRPAWLFAKENTSPRTRATLVLPDHFDSKTPLSWRRGSAGLLRFKAEAGSNSNWLNSPSRFHARTLPRTVGSIAGSGSSKPALRRSGFDVYSVALSLNYKSEPSPGCSCSGRILAMRVWAFLVTPPTRATHGLMLHPVGEWENIPTKIRYTVAYSMILGAVLGITECRAASAGAWPAARTAGAIMPLQPVTHLPPSECEGRP